MAAAGFDPFIDRRAREIRNGLSKVFIHALDVNNPEPFRRAGQELLGRTLPPGHRSYVTERLTRYERLFSQSSRDPLSQALTLWDNDLFFEAHERLESLWREATGGERLALQGLIKAAGAYVHLERGNVAVAGRLARKALALLREHQGSLPPAIVPASLLEKLEALDPAPPCLSRY